MTEHVTRSASSYAQSGLAEHKPQVASILILFDGFKHNSSFKDVLESREIPAAQELCTVA